MDVRDPELRTCMTLSATESDRGAKTRFCFFFVGERALYVRSQNIFCSHSGIKTKHRSLVEHRAGRMTSCWYEFVVKPVRMEACNITTHVKS